MNDRSNDMTPAEITDALNRVHDSPSANSLDDVLARIQWLSLDREEW